MPPLLQPKLAFLLTALVSALPVCFRTLPQHGGQQGLRLRQRVRWRVWPKAPALLPQTLRLLRNSRRKGPKKFIIRSQQHFLPEVGGKRRDESRGIHVLGCWCWRWC